MNVIHTSKAPAAIGPYEQAYRHGEFIFTSGQIGADPADGSMPATIEEQAELACRNVDAILKEAGSDLGLVLKTTCYLSDMGDFAAFNSVYAKYFGNKPARSCFAVKDLPKKLFAKLRQLR